MDSELVERIKELEDKARAYDAIQQKLVDLQEFVSAWDSLDHDRLPINHEAKINDVRRFIKFAAK
jgi:hypothetical protein